MSDQERLTGSPGQNPDRVPDASWGGDPNSAYCDRLTKLAFPERVRIGEREFDRESLRKELDGHGEFLDYVADRYFRGKGERTVEKVLEAVFPVSLSFAGKSYIQGDLRRALEEDPKLQQLVAVYTHYVPSKWLLEQEMGARVAWPGDAAAAGQPVSRVEAAEAAETGSAESGDRRGDIYRTVADVGLFGVCFSGGGIRSATFNLGVLQGLAQMGLLPWVDYLSTVSGGGYIHEFLAGWILRHRQGLKGVIAELIPQAEPGCLPRAPEPVKWLMRYASYLTPARGMFSTDTWTMVAIWMRNTILNQIPILAALACGFLVVHLLAPAAAWDKTRYGSLTGWLSIGLLLTEFVAGVFAARSLEVLGTNLARQTEMKQTGAGAAKYSKTDLLTNLEVQWKLIAPWLALAVWTAYWVQMEEFAHPVWYWIGPAIFSVWVLAAVLVVIFAGGVMGAWEALHLSQHEGGKNLAERRQELSAWRTSRTNREKELSQKGASLQRNKRALLELKSKLSGDEEQPFRGLSEPAPEIARLEGEIAHAERELGELAKSLSKERGLALGLQRIFDRDRRKWTGAMILFAAAGVLASLVACGIGYGFVVGIGPMAKAISGWITLSGGKDAVAQTLKFSVSGAAENFSATLAGSLNSAKDSAVAMRVDPWRIELTLLPGLLLSIPFIAIELALGLLGRDYGDMRREWLARLRAWSLLFALLWAGMAGVALLGPYVGYWLAGRKAAEWSAAVAFLLAHGATMFAGWSGKADGKPTENGILGFKPMDLLALIAAPVAILGILLAVSFGSAWVVDSLAIHVQAHNWLPRLFGLSHGEMTSSLSNAEFWLADAICIVVTLGVAALFGWRVDVNEFSMQSFYRNRLSRCYLGATVPQRQPDPFSGFDGRGELTLANGKKQRTPPAVRDLLPTTHVSTKGARGEYEGPFPIFCTTLNLTTGGDLATQERKGTSFAFTPLYSGYSVSWTDGDKTSAVSYNGFVPTEDYAYLGDGIHLDTAVAISGAAVNPNMGYNSNPALAFLMTFLNVRLGWWISNTRKKNQWKAGLNRPTPLWAAPYLFRELIGAVNDAAPYVNLSDGGHFENMGLYELVRRRCRYIVVCDAEGDAEMKFEGMGGAITKCRADFGAEIDLDLRPLRIDEKTGYSKVHCVVGTIQYPPPVGEVTTAETRTACPCLGDTEDDRYTGVIVYVKSSLVGDEPPDLLTYQLKHAVFPQDSTANQWFTETQFEAYRRLGHHVAMTAIAPALPPGSTALPGAAVANPAQRRGILDELFQRMYAIWYPRTPEMEQHLGDHLKQYEGILKELRERAELAGLEAALSDEHKVKHVRWLTHEMPSASLAYAAQFANSLLDFMYTVYTNLQLAFPDNRVSPHAEWWICLFRRWCRVDIVQNSWTAHERIYPEEFRLFARRELLLP